MGAQRAVVCLGPFPVVSAHATAQSGPYCPEVADPRGQGRKTICSLQSQKKPFAAWLALQGPWEWFRCGKARTVSTGSVGPRDGRIVDRSMPREGSRTLSIIQGVISGVGYEPQKYKFSATGQGICACRRAGRRSANVDIDSGRISSAGLG